MSARTVVSLALGASIAALSTPPQVLGQATPRQAATAEPVRCRTDTSVLCVQLTGSFPAASTVTMDSSASTQASEGSALRLGGLPYIGPFSTRDNSLERPTYLLILLDVSGSMTGDGITFVRAAIYRFISGLPERQALVAVVPFGSREVEDPIARARFVPPSRALAQVSAIPPPNPRANTALYSAVRAGARVLASRPDFGRSVRRAILLVTDGRNEVEVSTDDPGLLPNDSLDAATKGLRAGNIRLFALGVGPGVAEAQLDSLARFDGRLYISALEPLALDRELAQVRRELGGVGGLVFVSGADVSGLGRVSRDRWLVLPRDGGEGRDSLRVRWLPPLLSLPVFVAASPLRTASTKSLDDVVDSLDSAPLERWLYVLIMLVVTVLLWTVVPRVLWPSTIVQLPLERGAPDAQRGVAANSSVRNDVRDAPPRGPTAQTGEYPIAE